METYVVRVPYPVFAALVFSIAAGSIVANSVASAEPLTSADSAKFENRTQESTTQTARGSLRNRPRREQAPAYFSESRTDYRTPASENGVSNTVKRPSRDSRDAGNFALMMLEITKQSHLR